MFQDNTKNVLEYNPYLTVHQPWGSFVFFGFGNSVLLCMSICKPILSFRFVHTVLA